MMRALRAGAVAALVLCPLVASATDYSGLRHIFLGVVALVAALSGLAIYFALRGPRSIVLKSLAWGAWGALFFAPVARTDGPSTGPPFFDFLLVALLGADGAFLQGALLWFVIVGAGLAAAIGALMWVLRRPRAA